MPLLSHCLERKGCRLNRSVSSFWAFMPVGYFEFFQPCLFASSLSASSKPFVIDELDNRSIGAALQYSSHC